MYKLKTSRLLALSVTTAISLTTSAAIASNNSSPNFSSPIIDAAENGDLAKLQALIKNGGNPNERGEFGTTPLMRAVHNNKLDLVTVLLSNGANPNIGDVGGATAVSVAAREGHNEILAALIRQGAQVNTADNEGFTPLMRATIAGNLPAVQALIGNGANINQANNFGETALSQATRDGKLEIQEFLRGNGADDAKITAAAKPAPAASVSREVAADIQDEDKADIVIDFSNGKLSSSKIAENYKPVSRQVAAVNQKEYFAANFYVPAKEVAKPQKALQPIASQQVIMEPEMLQIPAKPQAAKQPAPQINTANLPDTKWISSLRQVARTAIAPYQISSNEMVAPGQNTVLTLGTFKTEEFANRKIESLKKSFPTIFATLPIKTIIKTTAVGTSFQINAGLVDMAQAKALCKQLTTAGVNCHTANSKFQSQEEFNNFAGDVSPATKAAIAEKKGDLLGAAPSPVVATRELSAPTAASSPAAAPAANTAPVAANADAKSLPPMALPPASPPSTAAAAPATAAAKPANNVAAYDPETSFEAYALTDVSKKYNEAAPAAGTAEENKDKPASAQALALKIITPVQASSAPTQTVPAAVTKTVTTVTPVTPTPAATPAPTTPPMPTAQPAAVTPTPAPVVTTTTTIITPPAAPAVATAPVVEVKTETKAEEPAPAKVVKKKRFRRSRPIPAAGIGAPPKDLTSGSALMEGTDGKFEVARPVKAATIAAPIPLSQQVWIKVSNFADAEAAHNFWQDLRSRDASFANYRMRTNTNVARPDLTSIEIGPFAGDEASNNACATIAQTGVNCTKTDTLQPRLVNNLPAGRAYVDDHNMPLVEDYDMSGGNWNIQLGSYDSYEQAQESWEIISKQSKHLKKIKSDIFQDNGKFRLRAGNFKSSSQADALCDELRNKAISCIIIKN